MFLHKSAQRHEYRSHPCLVFGDAAPSNCLWLLHKGYAPMLCRVKLMYGHMNQKNGEAAPLVSEALYNIVMAVRPCSGTSNGHCSYAHAAMWRIRPSQRLTTGLTTLHGSAWQLVPDL
jgi:hypothetical protein